MMHVTFLFNAGWAMQTVLLFYVSRKWSVDEELIRTRLQYFKETDFPIQFLLFPEGTDLSPSNKVKSDRYADENGLQKYDHVLHPKLKGFRVCVEEMRKGKIPITIVNMSIGYTGNIAQNESDFALGKWPTEIHFFSEQIPSSRLPSDESGLIDWLEQCWADKEKQLKDFYENGKFSAEYLSGSKAKEGLDFAFKVLLMWTIFFVLLGYSAMTSWFFWVYYPVVTIALFFNDKFTDGLDNLIIKRYKFKTFFQQ